MTPALEKRIWLRARAMRKPEAIVIRQLLEQTPRPADFDATITAALRQLEELVAKHGRTMPPDLSLRLDDYLYGNDRR